MIKNGRDLVLEVGEESLIGFECFGIGPEAYAALISQDSYMKAVDSRP